eukprot:TRINITY_DN27534_c0_g1_i2.p1 TRINITY_DN27534_c0_g1~~TRINITY_DN27534_c0_g1_i2.p1  ORF type:complete len:150 (+),score=11.45 TRINITY_DN27534_c0_g1_i2:1136-1585(+)
MALEESLYTISASLQYLENKRRASKIANTSTSLESPLESPSTLNFKTPPGGGDHVTDLLTLEGPHPIQSSQLNRISFKLKLENSFLTRTHLATLKSILDAKSADDIEDPLKIRSFLSFLIDHKMANGVTSIRCGYALQSGHPSKTLPHQ